MRVFESSYGFCLVTTQGFQPRPEGAYSQGVLRVKGCDKLFKGAEYLCMVAP